MVSITTKDALSIFQKHLGAPQNPPHKAPSKEEASSQLKSDSVELSTPKQRDTQALSRGIKDANEAIGTLQVADGALKKAARALEDAQWLDMAKEDQTLDKSEQAEINASLNRALDEIRTTLEASRFMGKAVFGEELSVQIGDSRVELSLALPEAKGDTAGFIEGIAALRTQIKESLGVISEGLSQSTAQMGSGASKTAYNFDQFDPVLFKRLHGAT